MCFLLCSWLADMSLAPFTLLFGSTPEVVLVIFCVQVVMMSSIPAKWLCLDMMSFFVFLSLFVVLKLSQVRDLNWMFIDTGVEYW